MSGKKDDLEALRKLWGGFWASRVVLTANNMGFFEALTKPMTALAAARATRTHRRGAELLMNALASMGLLRKTGAKFTNTPLSNRYLIKESPLYQGDILRHAEVLWKNWSGLDGVVKTGRPNRVAQDYRSFILGMHNISTLKVKDVLKAVGLGGVKSALDLGGGPGTYSFEMAKKKIRVTLFDFPEALRHARKLAKSIIPNNKNIRYMGGDFMVDGIGEGYDIVLVSQILHAYSPRQCQRLLKKSALSLAPGGRVVVQEFPIAPDMASPPSGALFAVNMLVNTEGGRCYPASEIAAMLKKCGLGDIRTKALADTVLVEGRKKG